MIRSEFYVVSTRIDKKFTLSNILVHMKHCLMVTGFTSDAIYVIIGSMAIASALRRK